MHASADSYQPGLCRTQFPRSDSNDEGSRPTCCSRHAVHSAVVDANLTWRERPLRRLRPLDARKGVTPIVANSHAAAGGSHGYVTHGVHVVSDSLWLPIMLHALTDLRILLLWRGESRSQPRERAETAG